MGTPIEHAGLIWAAKNGDRAALENLFRAYYDVLCRMAFRLAWDRTLAQDLAQETMVSAIRGFPEYRMECQFLWWLKRILYRRYADHLRKRRNEVAVDYADENPQDMSAERTQDIQIRQVFAKLPKDLRKTAELRFLLEYDLSEIAAELKIPEGTVKSRLHTIRQIVKANMNTLEGIQ
ncbi:MAG: sigma-70 family RNA polymerase sigma factor [Candidatus Edwardsbacteria bacterium]|nr:sigma-70 family RNA polymerase sigma factor [Candidatus Edwardsbacteria bacterium]